MTWRVLETGQTTTGLAPSIATGSAAPRTVVMSAAHPGGSSALGDIVTINLGFNHLDDAGIDNMGAGYDKAPEAVTGVTGLPRTGLVRFAAANIAGLVGHLSLRGLSALQFVECPITGSSQSTTGCPR